MKTKFVRVTDSGTLMRFLVIEFEDFDPFVDEGFVTPRMRLVLSLNGAEIGRASAYPSPPDCPPSYTYWHKASFPSDATSESFLSVLKYFNDIKTLPDPLDVKVARDAYWLLFHRQFVPSDLLETLADRKMTAVRKFAYRAFHRIHIALIDLDERERIYDCAGFREKELDTVWHWIPVREASREELELMDLIPFSHELILPLEQS
jgi:hypothetical protein